MSEMSASCRHGPGGGAMDGTCVHSCTPHYGQRVSLVLFTHECVLRHVPERLAADAAALGVASVSAVSWEQFSALGIRALAREDDWRLTAALSEAAEAVLEGSQLPYYYCTVHCA